MKLLVVILNYRVTELTIDCLRSIAPGIERVPHTKVVVCENGSGDDAAERLGRAISDNGWSSWAEVTALHPNRGFTGGNNAVLRTALRSEAPPEYFLLLNADTIVQDGAFESLVALLDAHPRAGIAGSCLLSPEGEVQASPFRFPSPLNQLTSGLRLGFVSRLLAPWNMVPTPPTRASRVHWVAGASMMLRTRMLWDIGLLDEGLFTYFDDVDFCLRARRAGWETWYVPESRVIHLEGRSTGIGSRIQKRRPAYWFEARRRFLLKSYGPFGAALIDAAYLGGFALWRARRRALGLRDDDPPHLLVDHLRHSVFVAGFGLAEVENPALAGARRAPARAEVP